MSNHKIICGKSETELKQFEDNTFDSCVCDPPYNLTSMTRPRPDQSKNGSYSKEVPFSRVQSRMGGGFMGKEWDGTGISFKVELWEELYRVMKPGAHILVAGIARTHHRMWVALEDAGFDIIDGVYRLFGSGFPKSLDIAKNLDKIKNEEPNVIGKNPNARNSCGNINICKKNGSGVITAPVCEEAKQFEGFGTQLKPAVEIWCLARKPISERNTAANVLKWGVGGLNIDGCRIKNGIRKSNVNDFSNIHGNKYGSGAEIKTIGYKQIQGRFPANLILECCCEEGEVIEGEVNSGGGEKTIAEGITSINHPHRPFHYGDKKGNEKCLIHTNPNCVCRMLDEQSGELTSGEMNSIAKGGQYAVYGYQYPRETVSHKSKGGASRFFYQAKASQAERWFYCTICKKAYPMKERDKHLHNAPEETKYKYLEFHPTQKPEDLICYLMRLITPPNGTTIDPFLGSGTAIIAAEREGFNCIGIDSNPEYCEIALRRGRAELAQQKISGEESTIERIGF